jgi:hypothetical protein
MLVSIQVKRSISVPDSHGKKDLKKGVHEVDSSILSHWFVKALIKQGTIAIIKKKSAPNYEEDFGLVEIQPKAVKADVQISLPSPAPGISVKPVNEMKKEATIPLEEQVSKQTVTLEHPRDFKVGTVIFNEVETKPKEEEEKIPEPKEEELQKEEGKVEEAKPKLKRLKSKPTLKRKK